MKNIKMSFGLLLLVPSILWLLADTLYPVPFTYFSFRVVFVQYTGVLAMALMSVTVMLSARLKWMERPLKGLDKMYRLHKWLGITTLVLSVLHWWWAKGTKWMVGWGLLERPKQRPRSGEDLSEFVQWLMNQRGFAESISEWAFYIAVILIVLALVKLFPYRLFKKTHKLMAVIYLILVYHSLILTKLDYWGQPIGWAMAILLLAGTISSVMVLTGRVGRKYQAHGVITSLESYPGMQVMAGNIKLNDYWHGHDPGQFAFVTSSKSEGAHPYTIASAWDPDNPSLRFIVKKLGDWTEQLEKRLKVSMPVTVEGPYGCFNFNDNLPRQIWIAAGIGITPFIAKMEHLAKHSGQHKIDLFHTTRDYDQAAISRLTTDAQEANVNLHLTVTSKENRLTPEQIRTAVPDWQSASIWFCGPHELSVFFRKDFVKHGLPAANYHAELFQMR